MTRGLERLDLNDCSITAHSLVKILLSPHIFPQLSELQTKYCKINLNEISDASVAAFATHPTSEVVPSMKPTTTPLKSLSLIQTFKKAIKSNGLALFLDRILPTTTLRLFRLECKLDSSTHVECLKLLNNVRRDIAVFAVFNS